MKALKSIGVVVFIDLAKKSEDRKLLPAQVVAGFKPTKGGSVPSVYLTSADLSENFGVFGYKVLKGKDFREIFREAKKKIREAKKTGALALTDSEGSVTGGDDEPGVTVIKDPELLILTTAKGAKIKAKLLRVIESENYVFETDQGKQIKARLSHLSDESQEEVTKILRENY